MYLMVRKRTYTRKHYESGDGMMTSVWGPPLWHFLHTMSFNYPVEPTRQDKRHYKEYIINLKYILPCGYCRKNLIKNFKELPLTMADMKNRDTFSRWVFKFHELVNTMLGKKSGLKYCDIRKRYENFRSRCSKVRKTRVNKTRKRKESGCTEPLYGTKSKCIVKIVPKSTGGKSFQMDKKCVMER